MFSTQYEAVDGTAKMQDFDGRTRTKLMLHLAVFSRPILNVYEQGTPITKATQAELTMWRGSRSRYAKAFADRGPS